MATSSIPQRMRAYQKLPKQTALTPQDVPTPSPAADEVLVRILAVGVCHTDVSITFGRMPSMTDDRTDNITVGHEGCGEIVALGSDVDDLDLQIGQRVAMLAMPGCQSKTCDACGRGLSRTCLTTGMAGLTFAGFFADYAAVKSWTAIPVPDAVPSEAGAISADAVLTAYHAVVGVARPKPDETVLVLGIGGVGFNGLQTLIHLGLKNVLVADTRKEQLDAAVKLGVSPENVILAQDEQVVQKHITSHGIHIDVVIDFAGEQATFDSAQNTIRKGGRIVMVGANAPKLTLEPLTCLLNEVHILYSYSGTAQELRECLSLLAHGVIRPQITTGKLADVQSTLEDLDAGKILGRRVLLP